VMTVAVATAGSIAVITDVFWRMMFWGAIAGGGRRRGGDRDGGGSNPLALIALVVVAVLAPLAAALLKAAISRRREALADATAVKLTRYPTGLRVALEKLDADSTVVRRTSHATSHLWIESPDDREPGHKGARLNSMFNTHPPLADRINVIRAMEGLPPYTGPDPAVLADLAQRADGTARRADDTARRAGAAAQNPASQPANSHPPLRAFGERPAAESMPQLAELFGRPADESANERETATGGDSRGSTLPPPPPAPPGAR